MKFRVVAAAAVLALGGSFATAGEVMTDTLPAKLNQLCDVTIGDKTFYDFTFSGNVAADQIQVVKAPGSDIGLEFLYNWHSSDGNNQDIDIQYKVHVNDPNRSIVGVNLNFDGHTNRSNTNLGTNANVTEQISAPDNTLLGQISVFNAGPNFSAVNRDSATFGTGPAHDLIINDDIQVHSIVDGGSACISLVDNTFHQTAVPLPAAAWTGLSTMGLAALGGLRRRVRGLVKA